MAISASSWAAEAAPTLNVVLSASDYHGYNISCFGMKDGFIHATPYGGTAPYSYKWSNGLDAQDIGDLAAGYYRVEVYDSHGEYGIAEITLEQPLPMKMDVDVYEYPNGYNVSCYECFNGNASVVMMGGAAPFAVSWSDGPSGLERHNLGPKDYKITVADANGCGSASTTIYLRGPARSDWSMSGNAGTTPGPQYIGTPDNKDVVFKSNGQERLRLKNNGDVKLSGPALTSGPLYLNSDGILRAGALDELPIVESTPCGDGLGGSPYWKVGGNGFVYPQCQSNVVPLLGTTVPLDLRLITNGLSRLSIGKNGKVGIGTTHPGSMLQVQGDLLVRDGSYGDIVTSSSTNTGPVLWARNSQAAWGLSIDANGKGHILGDWNNPHPVMTFAYDKVGIGNVTMGESDLYKLYVEGGIIGRDLKVTALNFPDYVFAPSYSLMPLDTLENFIASENHLPGFPSANEIKEAGGFEVGDMSTRLLKLAEEQSLYILQLNKQVGELQARITILEAQAK